MAFAEPKQKKEKQVKPVQGKTPLHSGAKKLQHHHQKEMHHHKKMAEHHKKEMHKMKKMKMKAY